MIKSIIKDSKNSNGLSIKNDGSIAVYVIPAPPKDNFALALPFAKFMLLDGVGTKSFLIDGSVSAKDFYVQATDYDIYVNTIVFVIADASATLNQFGNLGILANGLEFYYFNQESGKYTIEAGLKTNFDMLRLANFEPAFGTGTTAFQLTNAVSTAEAYAGVIDFEDVFGLQWGVRLRANTTDRVGFMVKDNLSGLDAMDVKCYGIKA